MHRCNNVLLISRSRSRRFIDQDALMAGMSRVAAQFHVPLAVYYGNESIPDMTYMFAGTIHTHNTSLVCMLIYVCVCEYAGACAVVGYHGAGHTNAVLCRKNTLVVEVTTHAKPGDVLIPWRSNKGRIVQGMDAPLVWRMYTVGYEHLHPTVDMARYNTTTPGQREKWNLHLKDKSILLGPYHIGNLSALMEEHLEVLFPDPTGTGTGTGTLPDPHSNSDTSTSTGTANTA
jgi:hypothetical protein